MFSHESLTDIDSYLEDLILQSVADTADEQSRTEIQEITKTLADLSDPQYLMNIVYSVLNNDSFRLTEQEIEVRVSELVHQFLIPTVHKIHQRHQSQYLTNSISFSFLMKFFF